VPDYRQVFAFRVTACSYYRSNKARELVEQICCVAASSDSPGSPQFDPNIQAVQQSNHEQRCSPETLIVISAQAEGIPVLHSVTPHFPLFRSGVFQRIIVIYNPYVSPPRLAIDRFDVRQFICENALDAIELVSFLDTAEGAWYCFW
jgi:hypothetical protein